MITILTGDARAVKDAILSRARALNEDNGKRAIVMIVPAQYTLQAEREVIGEGSFRLQVLSPGRLFARIFDEAGWPKGARIDEQGRIMLVQLCAKRLKKQLIWYQDAIDRRGFAEKALSQIIGFKQAKIAPKDLKQMADALEGGALKHKLLDLALIYDGYEQQLRGRFMDGEDEARLAAERVRLANFFEGADVFVYGFDMISLPMMEVLCALAHRDTNIRIGLPIGADARDEDLYIPLRRVKKQLYDMAKDKGVMIADEPVSRDFDAPADIIHLQRELHCIPQDKYESMPKHIQLAALKHPQDEAEFAAALIRQFAMDKQWRWREMAVIVQNLDGGYENALTRAFAQAEVPLFLPAARPADRHPAARCMLYALKTIVNGFQPDDLGGYWRAGFTDLSDDDIDSLMNYITQRGVRGKALKSGFKRLSDDMLSLETLRDLGTSALVELEADLKLATDVGAKLAAICKLFEALGLSEKIEAQSARLLEIEKREWAMEGPQVLSRIFAAMDQMVELIGAEPVTNDTLLSLLERALSVAMIKPLPQSGDAVFCGGMDHAKLDNVKALIVMGLSDMNAPGEASLLSESEINDLGEHLRGSAISGSDQQRMARLSLKSALQFVENYVLFTRPQSNAMGAALKPGALPLQLRRLCPQLSERGGLSAGAESSMRYLKLNAPRAAMARLGAMLGETPDDPYLRAFAEALGDDMPKDYPKEPYQLPIELAQAVYGKIKGLSITRLQQFFECPYQHFARYALRPEPFEPFELTARDKGSFYHSAMEQFMREHAADISALDAAESMAEMDRITAPLMAELIEHALGDSATALARGEDLRKTARRAAAMLAHQLTGSEFAPIGVEIRFGEGDAAIGVGDANLMGVIDRVDGWQDEHEQYARVIDYKTGGRSPSLAKIYYGLELQLMIYLSAAAKVGHAEPAGAFYFNVSDKLVDTDAKDALDIERERRKLYKLRGIAAKDDALLAAMNNDAGDAMPGNTSQGLIPKKAVRALMQHAVNKAEQAYSGIASGAIDAKPVQLDQHVACDFCEYAAVCQQAKTNVEKLPKLSPADVLSALDS